MQYKIKQTTKQWSVVSFATANSGCKQPPATVLMIATLSRCSLLPTTNVQQKIAKKQMQKNTLSLGDRVNLIDYAKKYLSVGSRRIAEVYM